MTRKRSKSWSVKVRATPEDVSEEVGFVWRQTQGCSIVQRKCDRFRLVQNLYSVLLKGTS